jgi:hypothetical protein
VIRTRRILVIVCGLLSAALLGCKDADEIRHYQVPREPRVRMLAAIVPHGERTWFVKVTGPAPALEAQKPAFRKFIESFRFDDKANPPLTWKVPEGWKRDDAQPAKGQFKRFATFRLRGPEGEDMELTVFPLGRAGQAGDVLANVNRWRGQLGLKEVTADELKGVIDEQKVGDTTAILVDMQGVGSRLAAMRPPFAGGAHPDKAVAEGDGPPTFQAPPGWKKAPLKEFSIATFQAGEGDQAVIVTVKPAAGNLAANLNLWRQQVGLPPVKGEQLKEDIRPLKMGDSPAAYVEYLGPEGQPGRRAIFGAIPARIGGLWFFKMSGPADAVIGQRAAFQEFLQSVRFSGGKEGHP